MSNQIEQIPAEIEREMQEIAELAPCCDFCHASDIEDREEWCKEKFRHFFIAGLRTERERQMKEAAYFPEYDSIVNKVFGAGNLESWELDAAKRLVRLAKDELLKDLASGPTIKGWVARDEDGALSFFGSKPYRNFGNWLAETCIKLNRKLFPALKMKNGPMKVELLIIRK